MGKEILVCYAVICNLIAFAAFGLDKYRAVKGKWRISEHTLFLLALAGGSAGALAGMYCFRHKTRKYRFTISIPLILAAHVLLLLFLTL